MTYTAKQMTRTQKDLNSGIESAERSGVSKVAKLAKMKFENSKRSAEQIKTDNAAALKRIFG